MTLHNNIRELYDRDGNKRFWYKAGSWRYILQKYIKSGKKLVGLKLHNANLSNFDFSGLSLLYVDFQGCDLSNCKFSNTKLNLGIFNKCDLKSTFFNDCQAYSASFEDCNWSGANLKLSNFINCKMGNGTMVGVNGIDCDFTGSDLHGGIMTLSNFYKAIFNGCDLADVRFRNAMLDKTSFVGCKGNPSFDKAEIKDTRFRFCEFETPEGIIFTNAVNDEDTGSAPDRILNKDLPIGQ